MNRPVAIYCRVSTQEQGQEGVSLDAQESMARAEAQRMGFEVGRVYVDIQSAKNTARSALQDLLAAVERREYGAVIIYDLSRLSRDTVDALMLSRRFSDAKCGLHFLVDPVDTSTPAGAFIYTLKAALGEMERKQIGQRVRMAAANIIASGGWIGVKGYGYRAADGRLEVVPDQAAVVNRVFRHFALEGWGVTKIARALNQDGVPTPTGGRVWHYSVVRDILESPMHHGVQRWGDMEGEWPFERIVPEEIAARARTRTDGQRRKTGPNTIRHIWTGVLRCGACGHPMVRVGWQGPLRGFVYYRCNRRYHYAHHAEPQRCSGRSICQAAMDAVEAAFLELIHTSQPAPRPRPVAVDAESQIAQIRERKRRLTMAYTSIGSSLSDEEYHASLRECDAEIARLSPAPPALHPSAFKTLAESWDRAALTEKNRAIRLLVVAAYVYRDRVELDLADNDWDGWRETLTVPRPR